MPNILDRIFRKPTTPKRMLVLTVLTSRDGIPVEVYRRFAGSLAATGFNGEIVIMTTAAEMKRGGLTQLEGEIGCLTFFPIPAVNRDGNVNCRRYLHFLRFLRTRIDAYDYVMLTDSRDVLFQKDISTYPFDPATDLFFAEEEKLIGSGKYTSRWIERVYGPGAIETLGDKPILCSGTTFGKTRPIIRYLRAMVQEIKRVEQDYIKKFGALGGIDQAIHNHLYYTNEMPGMKIKTVPNVESLVYTLHHVINDDKDRKFLNDEGQFINQNGAVSYCVHQFDRLDEAAKSEFNKRSPWKI